LLKNEQAGSFRAATGLGTMSNLRILCRFSAWFVLGLVVYCSQSAIAQDARPAVSNVPSTKRAKHTRRIDDLNAIGVRNIGGTRLSNWYSLRRETKIGRQYSNEIESFTKPLHDSFITEYVNRIGQTLVRNSDAKVPFTIKVIDSEEINALALPGGFLYVTSGLLIATEDEAELAGIMAHEIAHVAARHATRQMTRTQIFDLASLPLIAFGGGLVIVARETIGSLSTMKFSRNFESEADYLALEYAYKAGYDPSALISIMERLNTDESQSPGALVKAFATHPQTSDRIRKMQREIAHILPERSAYIVSTSDFDEMHSRLLSRSGTELHRRPDSVRPTLRRRDGSETDRSNASDEAPAIEQP